MKFKEILVVDDDDLILETLKDALEMEGYPVVTAQSKAKAIKYLKDCNAANLPGLILLDLRMPFINGFELLDEVSVNNHQIPIIVTSDFQSTSGQNPLNIIVDVLKKPWNLDELYLKVEKHYKSSNQLLAS